VNGEQRLAMMPEEEILEAVEAFCEIPGKCTFSNLGTGNINETYLVDDGAFRFVLQKINGNVFEHPEAVIANFCTVTQHLSRKTDKNLAIINSSPILTGENSPAYRSSRGHWWRAQSYVHHRSVRGLSSPRQARQIGAVLALFHKGLVDLNADSLIQPLPGFHDLRKYWSAFSSLEVSVAVKTKDDRLVYCLRVLEGYREHAMGLQDACEQGLVGQQIVHGDPKLENFIFDDDLNCLGILDLDTVGQGYLPHDIGDCLRSCCNVLGEMAGQQPVAFCLDSCNEFLTGYFRFANESQADLADYVYEGILHICFELGLRFLTDYLQGNLYFKVQGEQDNLIKAVTQFRLVEDVAAKEKEIRSLIKKICR
jgi:Ser/Thr protein kinase RdoA (MazF antagonist)